MSGTRISNLLGKITILFVICCCSISAKAKYGGGSGTAEEPYLIYDANQMNAIGANPWDWDRHFKLLADIDLSEFTGTSFNIIGTDWDHLFTGVFDGNGHTISNFTYVSPGTSDVGLFGIVSGVNAEIRNLGLIAPNVDTGSESWDVGSLVGELYNGTITNCYVDGGSVDGYDDTGGLVGYNRQGTITNCYSTGSVSGYSNIGGMVGVNDGTITGCYSTSSVASGHIGGGLVGRNYDTITNCYSTSSITGRYHAGGLVGENYYGRISNSYSIAGVSGNHRVGGLVGWNRYGTITNCYSIGGVSGETLVGGLVGYNSGHVVASFWDIETSGQPTSGGGKGKTTAQMMMAGTFLHWGTCGQVWTINEGVDYPRLAWEQRPGEPIVGTFPLQGEGDSNSPYLIHTPEQLNVIGMLPCVWDKHFKLMANIDLSQYTGTEFNIIVRFTGTFDGNGHTISNFTYESNDTDYTGLFGYVDVGGELKDLGLIEPNVVAGTGRYVGSLVGINYGTITDCYVVGVSVWGDDYVGGLVGYISYNGTINNCYSSGSVSGGDYVGGLVGCNPYGTITNSYSSASVSGRYRVGGIVGSNYEGTIHNCYSSGSAKGTSAVGGLVGVNNRDGIITNCYATGSVFGNWAVGGLVGSNDYGPVLGCFWDIQTSGRTTSDGGTGKITEQMQDLNTFLYWGVCGNEGVWTIDDGNDYPRLAWQNISGVLIVTSEPVYGGGCGTEDDPYQIWTAEQLKTIGLVPCHWDKHFLLCADVDMSCFSGIEFNIIGYYKKWNSPDNKPFTGVFDGNGHTISNFSYTSTDTQNIGLFGYVTGEIKNLGLVAPDVNAGTGGYVGSLVGRLEYGTINKCYIKGGNAKGSFSVGGLVGYNGYGSTVTNCYSTGSVEGNERVGGLVGDNTGMISRCYSTGSVMGDDDVGGLVGENSGAVGLSYWDIETSGFLQSAAGEGKTTAEMKSIRTYQGWGCGQVWTIDDGVDYPRLSWENALGILIEDEPRYYGGGSGTESDPYLIYTAEQLNTIGRYPADFDCHFSLMADIDMSGTRFNIIGYGATFSGIFDGNGYVVRNVHSYSHYGGYMGLFGSVDSSGEVKNLGLEHVGIYAINCMYIGGLVGHNSGTITNCYSKSGIEAYSYVGGLVGFNEGIITNCYSLCSAFGDSAIGGLVGYNSKGTVTGCHSTARISGLFNDEDDDWEECFSAGGLVGTNTGMISNCRATIKVWTGGEMVGGLVGENYKGAISNCYSTGFVECCELAGGLVGLNYGGGTISECYSTTYVRGDHEYGGLVGGSLEEWVTNSFWDIETSGQATSNGGTGLTTDQMHMMNTFTEAGWDFVGETVNGIEDIWFIPQGDYPRLWWEGMQVPMKLTPRTLNCKSYGNWVKACLTLPEGFTVADVDANRPAVLHSFGFQSADLHVSVDEEGLVEILTAFERQALCSLVGNWPEELTVAGFLTDGNIYLGTSSVRIIAPKIK